MTFSNAVSGSGSLQKQGEASSFSAEPRRQSMGRWVGNGQRPGGNHANSAIGTGDLAFAQSSGNNPTVILNNPTQTIGIFPVRGRAPSGTIAQTLELNGTALTINETANAPIKVFGYGAVSTD